jgi:hypothetical protein
MKKRFFLVLPLLAAACSDESTGIDLSEIRCTIARPNVQGTWVGTLNGHNLSVTLTEDCRKLSFFAAPTWWTEGQWTWNGQQGYALGLWGPDYVTMDLRLGTTPQPTSTTELRFNTTVPVTGTQLTGTATGRWRVPTDTTQILGTFNATAVVLQKQ